MVFDSKDLLKIDSAEHREVCDEIFTCLIECLPKETILAVKKSGDYSILYALTYELLRLYVIYKAKEPEDVEAALSKLRTYQDSTLSCGQKDKLRRTYLRMLIGDQKLPFEVDPKKSKSMFLIFQNEYLAKLVTVLKAHGFSRSKITAFMDIADLLQSATLPFRLEPSAANVHKSPGAWEIVPYDVNPTMRGTSFRDLNFMFRWSLLFECWKPQSLDREKSLRLFANLKKNVCKFAARSDASETRKRFSKSLPSFNEYAENKSSISKKWDLLNKPWCLEFMHLDYAKLIEWDRIREMSRELGRVPFIANFVEEIGAHILKAHQVKQWTYSSKDWNKNLNKLKKHAGAKQERCTLKTFGSPNRQPIEIPLDVRSKPAFMWDGKNHVRFDYMRKIRPSRNLHVEELPLTRYACVTYTQQKHT